MPRDTMVLRGQERHDCGIVVMSIARRVRKNKAWMSTQCSRDAGRGLRALENPHGSSRIIPSRHPGSSERRLCGRTLQRMLRVPRG